MTEFEFLIELHKNNRRQGPGSIEATKRAFNFTGLDQKEKIKIADIGCGTGEQTITLAENKNAQIIAIDYFKEFIEVMNERIKQNNIENIITQTGDMNSLDLLKESFDLIWSEGAIYIMGFENGINNWRKFIKTNGFLAVSELSWITSQRPTEIEEHWNEQYPEINTMDKKIKQLFDAGYKPIANFVLPENCWIDNYYKPLEKALDNIAQKYKNEDIQEYIDNEIKEIELYKKFKDYLSYVFYIAQKI
jgi:ubiquinone/menaquinone biosynthesis C-methylase UbiE